MSAPVSYSVTGADDVARRIGALANDVDDLQQPFADVADRIAQDARAYAPKRTGRLAGSIVGSATARGGGARTSLAYAGPINFGWPRRGIGAALFMQRAADTKGADAADQLAAEVQRRANSHGLG